MYDLVDMGIKIPDKQWGKRNTDWWGNAWDNQCLWGDN